jgi:UDP:flavonoid glycosyltransferase YjiC (YdhE family)
LRVLFTCLGGYGHFHPVAPLALAVKARGHDLVVATGPDFVGWVRKCGLPAEPSGLTAAENDERVAGLGITDPRMAAFHRFSTVAVPPMATDLLELARSWSPDVVVHEEGEYAGPLAAARLGIPCVTHSWAAPARPGSERALYRELLAPIWEAHGVSGPAVTSGQVYLDACPPPYQTSDVADIPGVTSVKPVPFDGPDTPVPGWLVDLPRPAVYVTFGTVAVFSTPQILRLAVEALAPLATVVVTTGPNAPDVIAEAGERVHVERYLPQSLVLPRVDLVVSHGGAGTTVGALTHALPHLVVPGAAPSQVRNAQRTEALGLGRAMAHDQMTAATLRDAARELLTDQSYKDAAASACKALDDLPGVDTAVDLIEALTG